MDGDATDVVAADLDLPGMEASPNVNSEALEPPNQLDGATDRPAGSIEGG